MRRIAASFVTAGLLALGFAGAATAGSICGTVRDQATSAPVAHAGVFVRTPAGAYTGLYGATDLAGAYCISGIAAGTYDLEVLVDDYRIAYVRGVVVTSSSTGVDLPATLGGVRLAVPAPNPARATSRLSWTLPAAGRVRLSIYDARGRLVRAWQDAELPAGEHSQQWDLTDSSGRAIGAGVYFVHLDTATGRLVRALVRMP